MEIKVMKNILGANQERSDEIRTALTAKKTLMLNLIGSPGAGKTSLLERTIAALKGRFACAVIEGDLATDRDAQRLKKQGIPVVLINTDNMCHLEALSIGKALGEFDLEGTDIIFIENVGNLVCPAEFDVGEHAKIAVLSTTEGDDKPAKYPLLFRSAEALVLNKTDLLEVSGFNRDSFLEDMKKLNAGLPVFEVSCRRDEGIDKWTAWLQKRVESLKSKAQKPV